MTPPPEGFGLGSSAAFTPTVRSQVRRRPDRAAYDQATVFEILDAGIMAHVGYVIDGQPFVTPTAYWREGTRLYWHGAAASRMLSAVGGGAPICVTVSFLDGLVVGRSGIKHSLNFRSVMAFGRGRLMSDLGEKRRAMDAFIDRLYSGRPVKLRPTTDLELQKMALVEMEIEEASAKIKNTGVDELVADEGWAAWFGVFPVETRIGAALPDPGVSVAPTSDLSPYAEGRRLDEALRSAAYGLPVST